MKTAAIGSRRTPSFSQTHGDRESFEPRAVSQKDGMPPRKGKEPLTRNKWACWRKNCLVKQLPEDPTSNVFYDLGNSVLRSGYDFVRETTNQTGRVIGSVFHSPYGGAAAVDYFTANHTGTPYNWTGASPAGLPNLAANGSRTDTPHSGSADLVFLAAGAAAGAAAAAAAAWGAYGLYEYMTQPPPPQAPPIAEVVPLNSMPGTWV
jgi:hypothetical protein